MSSHMIKRRYFFGTPGFLAVICRLPSVKARLHDAISRTQFLPNSLIRKVSLWFSIAVQKNRLIQIVGLYTSKPDCLRAGALDLGFPLSLNPSLLAT